MSSTEYRVRAFLINGKHCWFVYKLKSVNAPDETGNRIYKGGNFDTEVDARKYADLLNTYGDGIERQKGV